MYHTDLVLPEDIENFDHNTLSKFDYYVFVIVGSQSDYRLALTKIGPLLASCDALCFLIDRDRLELLASSDVLNSLYQSARVLAPTDAVSFIAAISKRALRGGSPPQGQWFELFLSLEDNEERKEKKLLDGIQEALSSEPKDFVAFSPVVQIVLEGLFSLLLGKALG